MVVDSISLHAEFGPNDQWENARCIMQPTLILKYFGINYTNNIFNNIIPRFTGIIFLKIMTNKIWFRFLGMALAQFSEIDFWSRIYE